MINITDWNDMKKELSLLLCIIYSAISLSQTEYKVGTSVVSIEPEEQPYSIALAGYGYPPEGRFSIEWIKLGRSAGTKSIAGTEKMLYAVNSSGTLFSCDITKGYIGWKQLQSTESIRHIACMGGRLYSLGMNGCLSEGKINKGSVSWSKLSDIPDALTLTTTDNALFITTKDGLLKQGILKNGKLRWQILGTVGKATGLAGGKGRLYYLSEDRVLWSRKNLEEDTDWIKIGYPNSISYDASIKLITVAGSSLYAVNDYGELLVARHNTQEDLSARTLAITKGDKTAIIIALDLTGFDYSLACSVKQEIQLHYGILPEAVMINASHTHFAPVAQKFPTWGKHQQLPDSTYLNGTLKRAILHSVEKALESRKQASLSFYRGETQIGSNRSLSGADALHDPSVDIVQINYKNGENDLLFITACHPVFKNENKNAYIISSNFPGIARRRLEEKLRFSTAIFLQGCGGDINPVDYEPEQTGARLADDVINILKKKPIPITGEIKYSMDSVLIPSHAWSKEKILRFREENGRHPDDVEAVKNVRWADMMLEYYDTGCLPSNLPVYVQTFNIGSWKLVGLSREAVTDYSLSIKDLWPDSIVSVLGYTNDVPSYLPNATHIRQRTYEGYGSFFWNAQPSFFPENILDIILNHIKPRDSLKTKNLHFDVGSSTVSLEPDNSIFSLTLAGYGAPAEGRFSLTWEVVGNASDIVDISGTHEYLYGIDKRGNVYRKELPDKEWEPLRSSRPVRHIASSQNILYAIGTEGSWLYATANQNKEINWKELDSSLPEVSALTTSEDRLYAATTKNKLWEGIVHGKQISWHELGHGESILSLTSSNNRLFALTSNQILWKRNTNAGDIPWTKIGYNNSYTYNVDLRQIAVCNGRLYSIGTNGKLYVARHSSNGNLTARAMAIRKGEKTAVIVSTDLTGFDYSFINSIKSELKYKVGIPAEAILINASHTHFAPVTQGWYSWIEPNQYPDTLYLLKVVKPGIVQAVSEAIDRLQPAALYFASTQTFIGGNRCLSKDEAIYDSTLDVLKTEDYQGKLKDILFITGCHPVFRNAGKESFTLSGNFPSVAKNIIMHGSSAANALFLQGCAGDINPLYEDSQKMGQILAQNVLSAIKEPMEAIRGDISYYMDSILISVKPWTKEQIERFRQENMLHAGDLEADKNIRWANIMLEKYAKGNMPNIMPIYVQTLNIGDWKLIGLSREAVTQYGIEIRKLWPGKHVSVAGYCNDVCSYLPAASHIRARTYEGYNSFFWYSQPSIFPEDILDRIVSTIKKNNH